MTKFLSNSDKRFFQRIYEKVGKAVHQYNLITEGDKIVVGLSGGKDSLSLLDILAGRMKYSDVSFQVTAVHVDIVSIPYEVDRVYLKNFCESREIPFQFVQTELSDDEYISKDTCFVCSWNRRKILFEKIRDAGYRKLALGHHKNDVVETLLMNMVFQGSISSMPAKLDLFGHETEIIRPLITLSEDELAEYASRKGFSTEIRKCPFEDRSKRREIREIIGIMKKMNPEAVNNMFASMSNIQKKYLPSD